MISFSGIDCSGKSTQIEKVIAALSKDGYKCKKIWSRGGYTPLLEGIKNLIRSDKKADEKGREAYRQMVHKDSKKRKILLWVSILDMALYYGVYFRILELRRLIIADRYIWDSYIDFKMKYPEFDFETWWVWKFLIKIYKKPRLAIIYTIPAEMSMYRSGLKEEPFPEDIGTRRIRIGNYLDEIKKGHWDCIIDATVTIEEVFDKTIHTIRSAI